MNKLLLFQNLAVDLDTEGRYLFLNCIANQGGSSRLSFPCLTFSCFCSGSEQIGRHILKKFNKL
jgi:hypothetical protein